MDHFAGLDVSVKETSVCILDDVGKIVKEVKVASEPQALLKVLGNPAHRFKRIGLKAGPLSQWLFSRRSRVTSDLYGDAAHAGGAEGAGLTVGFGITRFISLHEVDAWNAHAPWAHGRRPRRRCWGIGGGHRPALSAEGFFAGSRRRTRPAGDDLHVSARSRQMAFADDLAH